MTFKPFRTTLNLVRSVWAALSGIAIGLRQGLRQKTALPAAPSSIPSPPAQTIDLSPTEVEIVLTVESAPDLSASTRLPDWGEDAVDPVDQPAPASDRTQTVIALLDEAFAQGITTYPALIAYVKDKTGTGCSRRVVAAWKQSRKLVAKGEAA